jgi:hypothetical protein
MGIPTDANYTGYGWGYLLTPTTQDILYGDTY